MGKSFILIVTSFVKKQIIEKKSNVTKGKMSTKKVKAELMAPFSPKPFGGREQCHMTVQSYKYTSSWLHL